LGNPIPLFIEVDDGTTIEALLHILAEMLGKRFCRLVFKPGNKEINTTFNITVNGIAHWNLEKRLATALCQGDRIQLTPILAGG
jgi:hypothetical protein